MKRFLLLLLLAFAMWELQAQIPYFASTAGDGKLYGYTSLKLRPGINTQETYTTFQYGIGNSVALGTDIYTGVGSNYMGFLARYGVSLSKWFNVGAQFTPSFNLSHNFEFGYLTSFFLDMETFGWVGRRPNQNIVIFLGSRVWSWQGWALV